MTTSHQRRTSLLVLFTLLAGSLFFLPSIADAQSNPFQRGPNPTASGLQSNGSYSVATSSVSSSAAGSRFGGGTIYYPTGTNETFGGVSISPGFTARQSSMSWYGRRLASHGFVIFTIDTNSTSDQPNSRGTQLLAANDYLASSSPAAVRARLDSSRMAVMGHSMGGGGSLAASNSRSSLKASIPLTPWHTTKTWGSVRVPQLIIGAQNDSTASVSSHAIPFYNGLPNTTPKLYVELARASHFVPNSDDPTISRLSVSWLKRFMDNDARYNQFLCGASRPTTGSSAISRVNDNCSTGWGSGGATPTPTTAPPTTAPPATTTTTAPPSSGTCVRSSNQTHVNNDRARSILGTAYAIGSGDRLGSTSYFVFSSLRQTSASSWSQVSSC